MQHYSGFEWILYRSGLLSERMINEMNEHLESCDKCLESYLSTLEESAVIAPVSIPGIQPTSRPVNFNRNSIGRIRWASVALILVFLAILMGFTPQGQVVLAQIRTTLENFGNSLTELFGLPEDSPYVQDDGQIQKVRQNLEIKLDQYMMGKDRLTYSLLISGLPEDTQWVSVVDRVHFDEDDDTLYSSNTIDSKWVDEEQKVYASYHAMDLPENISLSANIHIKLEIIGFVIGSRTQQPRYIYGTWTFEFDMDSHALIDDTQIYKFSKPMQLNGKKYEIDSLTVSPFRQLLTMKYKINEYPKEQNRDFLDTNFKGFLLTTNKGQEVEFRLQSGGNIDENTSILIFIPDGNQYEKLKDASTWRIVPYIAVKHWDPIYPGIKGYYPLEEYTILVERGKIDQNSGEGEEK
ncbi:MAG: hypothetical protein AB9907_04105 [Flexilinea sp.]